jgi:WD40 repeat protein
VSFLLVFVRACVRACTRVLSTIVKQKVTPWGAAGQCRAGADGAVRLHDLSSEACYKPRGEASTHHSGGVLGVAWADDGTSYATCGVDGHVKLWDGVAQQCRATLSAAHGALAVVDVHWSRSSHYLLTAGANGTAAVWDMRTNARLVSIGTPLTSAAHARSVAWSHDERTVLLPNPVGPGLLLHSTRSGQRIAELSGHSAPVVAVAASPVEPALLSGSVDMRARFWFAPPSDQ